MKTKYHILNSSSKGIIFSIFLFTFTQSFAQELSSTGGQSLGKIPVYTFRFDSLHYSGMGYELSAVGTELSADLYITKIDKASYFTIVVDGVSYAVISNPYSGRVSSRDYYRAWLFKDGEYIETPKLTHMAGGGYFLQLPYVSISDNDINSNSNSNTNATAIVSSSKSETKLDWQILGKVEAVSDIRTRRLGGEDDVIYEKEAAFLLSAFDGDNLKYKLSIPRSGAKYDVYSNGSYNAAKIRWDNHGKHVWSIPSLGQMYTHRAGGYYFNIGDVKP